MGGTWGRRVNHAAWGTMAYYFYGRLESTCLSQTASMTEEAFEKHVLAFSITFCVRYMWGLGQCFHVLSPFLHYQKLWRTIAVKMNSML